MAYWKKSVFVYGIKGYFWFMPYKGPNSSHRALLFHTIVLLLLSTMLIVFTCPLLDIWAAPSEFVTYRLCEQRRFRRACASAQSRQNLRCSLIKAVSQEEPSDRKLDPWPRWMAGHAQLKFVMTECSKTQIRLTGPICILPHKNPSPVSRPSSV